MLKYKMYLFAPKAEERKNEECAGANARPLYEWDRNKSKEKIET